MLIYNQTVIRVDTDWDGYLGIKKDIPSAIELLVKHGILDGDLCLENWNPIKNRWEEGPAIKARFGENWKEVLKEKSISELQKIFEDYVYFSKEEIWEVD